MSSKRWIGVIVLWGLGMIAGAVALRAEIPLGAAAMPAIAAPQDPCVASPRAGTSWDIVIRYADVAGKKDKKTGATPEIASPARPVSIHTEYDQRLMRTVVTWSDGTKSTGLVVGDRVLLSQSTNEGIVQISPQDGDYLNPFYTRGFNATAWITAAQYVGAEKMEGQLCYKFVRASAVASSAINGDAPLPELVAWVRVEDKMPVMVKLGETVYSYTEWHAFTGTVELTSDQRQLMEDGNRQQKALEIMRQMQR